MKPTVQLSGEDGNVFLIIGHVAKALRRAGLERESVEFRERAMKAGSYDAVLQLCFEYVEVK